MQWFRTSPCFVVGFVGRSRMDEHHTGFAGSSIIADQCKNSTKRFRDRR